MNSVQLSGNLARDPEVNYTKTGRAYARFTVAATHSYVDFQTKEQKEMTNFINCVAWGKLGEGVGNLRKGNRVFVEGRIQSRSYEAQDGTKRYVTEVIANFVGQSVDTMGATGTMNADSHFSSFGGGVDPMEIDDTPF